MTPPLPSRLYLTGFMASGKSTAGPLLADALGYRFVDLDWLVEARARRSVQDLFAEGEGAFREAEAEALAETARGERIVVATGGGALVRAPQMALARQSGLVVWLKASPEATLRRVGLGENRPLLLGPDGRPLGPDALGTRVRALLEARAPRYARAHLTVDADAPPEAVVRSVLDALREGLQPLIA